MLKLVIVTLAVTIAMPEISGTRAAAATQIRSSAISSRSSDQSSTNPSHDRRLLTISKCTIKRYRRPHFQS